MASFLFTFTLNASPAAFGGITYSETFHHAFDMDQYARLADALIHGRVDLNLPVSPELNALADPYDFQARFAVGSSDAPIFWDHAFYEGRYYCYFGVVPAVLVYVPYELLTGQWLSTPVAIGILGLGAIAASSLLVWRIGRRYFPESATTLSLSLALFIVFHGANYVYLAFVPRFYSVPIMASLGFTALGLWFWMGARRTDASHQRFADRPDNILSPWMLAAGSTCMALNLGCRPQFILACLLAFPLFKDEIFASRELFSRKGWKNTLAALAPFAVVFTPLLLYNQARFGSPLDFGSDYNLTGFNMPEYHQGKMLTVVLFAMYLFCPPTAADGFPFVAPRPTDFLENQWAPNEPFFGGVFVVKPVLLLALALPFAAKGLKHRGLWGFSVAALVLAAAVLLVDVRTAGLTERYISDFAFYISLVACFVLLVAQSSWKSWCRPRQVIAVVLLAAAVAFTVGFGSLELASPDRYDSIAATNPALYQSLTDMLPTP